MNPLQQAEMQEIEAIDFTDQEQASEIKERFKIESLDQLNWAFRKISAIEAQKKEIQKLAQAEMERITAWEESELKGIQGSMDFFTFLIHEYHQKQLEENPKQKTIATPYGKSKARSSKEAPEASDKHKLLEHIKSAGLTEYIKEEANWGDFKKELQIIERDGVKVIVDENGQEVPGVKVKPETISFKVEVE
ncbi:host-nuclease inhibitor Gam family protein [Bacillus sp. FJAT-45350]|uniref:host-nuclease inhibitor Gam family protein n=1 Tax=Bacillus sp. FJAT-45350 TaxID=2011014 RepID=UPI000BB98344|nr:host-nuclease inhibitor Gam family protein [Bacillus sp. FJAT-45350]